MLLLCYYYDVISMLLFLVKKDNQKNKNNTCEGMVCMLLRMAHRNIPAYIYMLFHHAHHPSICVQYYFSYISFYFTVFFILPPCLFRQRPLVLYIFLFFCFQKQAVFLFLQEKSTKAHNSFLSHRDMFQNYSNTEIPQNVPWYKISEYIL